MCFLQFVVIVFASVEVITRGSSARLAGVPSHGHTNSKQILQDKTSKERTTIPTNFHKADAFSSFAYNIPLQHKTRSFYSKKLFGKYPKTAANGTVGFEKGESNIPHRNDNGTAEMVGEALSFVASTLRKDANNNQLMRLALKASRGSSARLARVPSHGHTNSEQIIQDKTSKERTTIPTNFHKAEAFSSFAYNIPLQHKTRSFYSKKLFGKYPKTAANGTVGFEKGESNIPHRNDNGTVEMAGEALSFVASTLRKDANNSQLMKLAVKASNGSGTYGRYRGNQKIPTGSIPILTTPGNSMGNTSIPLQQFKHKGKHILTTSIVKIGKPLIFAERNGFGSIQDNEQESKKANYNDDEEHDDEFAVENYNSNNNPMNKYYPAKLARLPEPGRVQVNHVPNKMPVYKFPFVGKGGHNQASKGGLYSFLMSVHNSRTGLQSQETRVPVKGQTQGERVGHLGNQLTHKPTDHAYFQNRTTYQNNDKVQAKVSQEGMGNVRGESDEVIGGYGAEDIANHFRHSNKSLDPFSGINYAESLKQGMSSLKPPFRVTEHNQATVNVIHGAGRAPGVGQNTGGHVAGTIYTNYQGNATNYNEEDKNVDTEQHNNGQEEYLLSQAQSSMPKEDQDVYSLQRAQNSNLGQDQVRYTDEYQSDDTNLPSLAPIHGYMPVDEFGLPFYGNDTDEYFKRVALAAHNRYRVIHWAPPLELDPKLSVEAERSAKRVAKLGSVGHEITRENLTKDGEGENVAKGCSEWGGLTASGAVHRWYSQVCNYDWNKPIIQPEAKKFMQLIWKGTRKMGIGRAMGMLHGLPCTFIVARYRPGKLSASGLESNIGKGLFLPSYCNADGDLDKGLLSTGYPLASRFLPKISDPALSMENEESPHRVQPLSTGYPLASSFLPKTSDPAMSMENEESPHRVQPLSTGYPMASRFLPKDSDPAMSMENEESPHIVQPLSTGYPMASSFLPKGSDTAMSIENDESSHSVQPVPTGYPMASSFLPKGSQRAMSMDNDESPHIIQPLRKFQISAEDTTGEPYVPLTSLERNIDEQDMEGFSMEHPDTEAPNRFLPHVSYIDSPYGGGTMLVEDNGLKRDYEPSKENVKYPLVVSD